LNHNNEWQGAAFESGLDNSPMYDGIPFDTSRHIMLLADVGLMGLYIKDCKALVELAKITGNTQVVDELLERKELVEKALATMWDEDFGLFLNRHLESGEFSYRISPTNFYALFADSVTEEQKHRIVKEHFYNPQEFWGEWIMPAISRTDPAFGDQTYWRGRIWAPMNYLVYMAMKGAGLDAECKALAEKSEDFVRRTASSTGFSMVSTRMMVSAPLSSSCSCAEKPHPVFFEPPHDAAKSINISADKTGNTWCLKYKFLIIMLLCK
jgi:neutral trehalase